MYHIASKSIPRMRGMRCITLRSIPEHVSELNYLDLPLIDDVEVVALVPLLDDGLAR